MYGFVKKIEKRFYISGLSVLICGKMRKKLEITRKLERMDLRSTIAILNLPAPYHCDKGCKDCVIRGKQNILAERSGRLPLEQIKRIMDLFARQYGTVFITINGRGDPFHREVREETLEKISYANERNMQALVFTAGDNLDDYVCGLLAECRANVMISLFGNGFIDAEFFGGRVYSGRDELTAENLRRLMRIYRESPYQPEDGTARLGFNYVVDEQDMSNPTKLMELREAARGNGLFFLCNTNFIPHPDPEVREQLRLFALEQSDFNLAHSTFAQGVCQMGAGSSVTIAADGEIYRCPYMTEGGEGKIIDMSDERLKEIMARYMNERRYACVLRKTRN
jgi:MoaA/NifB/PqqE/SkfB family radical SAM enzyme